MASSDEADEEVSETSVTVSGASESVTGSNSIEDSATHLSQTAGQTPMSPKSKQMWGFNDDPANTSDEDQEDLPYDGDLVKQYALDEKTSVKKKTVNNCANVIEKTATDSNIQCALSLQEPDIMVRELPNSGVDAALVNTTGGKEQPTDQREPEEAVPTSEKPVISDLLLRHFTQEQLLNATEFIDAETLPDVSLMESLDDTVVSMVSQLIPRHGEADCSHSNGDRADGLHEEEVISGVSSPLMSEREEEESLNSQVGPELERSSRADSAQHSPESDRSSSPQPHKAEDSIQRYSLVRTRSFSELKYGQGQVHYPLPDFSKVAPKVKFPKASSAVRSVCPSPGILRAQSSPGMLAKSFVSNVATMNVISRVLEDTIPPPEKLFVFKEQECQGSIQHMQVSKTVHIFPVTMSRNTNLHCHLYIIL